MSEHLDRLERLLPPLHASCVRWARRCCGGDHDEALDLVQELYLRLWDGRLNPPSEILSTVDDLNPLKAWLFEVLRRLASNQVRKLKRHIRLLRAHAASSPVHLERESAYSAASHVEASVIERQERNRTQVAIKEAIGQLSSRQREVIELVFDHELTIERAAEVMGVSVGSARVHYDRAKRKLATLLVELSPHSASDPSPDLSTHRSPEPSPHPTIRSNTERTTTIFRVVTPLYASMQLNSESGDPS